MNILVMWSSYRGKERGQLVIRISPEDCHRDNSPSLLECTSLYHQSLDKEKGTCEWKLRASTRELLTCVRSQRDNWSGRQIVLSLVLPYQLRCLHPSHEWHRYVHLFISLVNSQIHAKIK